MMRQRARTRDDPRSDVSAAGPSTICRIAVESKGDETIAARSLESEARGDIVSSIDREVVVDAWILGRGTVVDILVGAGRHDTRRQRAANDELADVRRNHAWAAFGDVLGKKLPRLVIDIEGRGIISAQQAITRAVCLTEADGRRDIAAEIIDRISALNRGLVDSVGRGCKPVGEISFSCGGTGIGIGRRIIDC